jgi:hypothetical protein
MEYHARAVLSSSSIPGSMASPPCSARAKLHWAPGLAAPWPRQLPCPEQSRASHQGLTAPAVRPWPSPATQSAIASRRAAKATSAPRLARASTPPPLPPKAAGLGAAASSKSSAGGRRGLQRVHWRQVERATRASSSSSSADPHAALGRRELRRPTITSPTTARAAATEGTAHVEIRGGPRGSAAVHPVGGGDGGERARRSAREGGGDGGERARRSCQRGRRRRRVARAEVGDGGRRSTEGRADNCEGSSDGGDRARRDPRRSARDGGG